MAIIFGDYVAGFLGLGREGNSWSMDPFDVRPTTPFHFSQVSDYYASLLLPTKDK